MSGNGYERRDDSSSRSRPGAPVVELETLRNATASAILPEPSKGEERISWFWRIFGGTLLSLAGLTVVTLSQQVTNNLHDLRSDLNRLNEARGDLVKKDELNSRITSVWNSIKDLQTVNATLTAAKERVSLLEQQVKNGDEERKELVREVQRLRERLVVVEGRRASSAAARPAAGEK